MDSTTDFVPAVLAELSATPAELVAAVAAAVGIYLTFLVLVRIFGPRSLHGMSTFDAILVIMFGAVAGRVILGFTPTLLCGMVALTTLFLLEAAIGQVRSTVSGTAVLNARPVLVVAAGTLLPAALRHTHLTQPELHSALRVSGIHSLDEVACAIFEPNGHLSVIRFGSLIDPALIGDVVGRDMLPESLLQPPPA